MEIENTPLYQEAMTVLANGPTSTNFTWEALIHYGNNALYKPLAVISVNTDRDYISNYADLVTLTLSIPLGDYARLIYPNRVGLEITLIKKPLKELSDDEDTSSPIESERYSAVLLDQDRSPTIAQGQEVNDIQSMNLAQILDVHFQIYNKAIEQLRVKEIGSCFRNCKVSDVISTLLTDAVRQLKVSQDRSIIGVEIAQCDNQDKKDQIVVTHGTQIFDVADLLQYRYGIYNAGLGSYIQNKNWYIYPLYDTTEFHQRDKTLTLLILPKRKFASIERTYQVNGNSTIVLITDETSFKDDSGTNYLVAGNGARYTDASKLMDTPVTTGSNKAVIKRDSNNSEFVAGAAVGVNYIATANRKITANPFVTYSAMAAKNGGTVRVVWQNSDPSLVIPGMAVKVVFMDGSTINEIYGIVHQSRSVSHRFGGYGNPRFKNQTVLDLFVNSQVSQISA